MHIDTLTLPTQPLETDLCIVGAGPAGIALAREFLGMNRRVALLESGGFLPEPVMQSLNDGDTDGDIKSPGHVTCRQFGGNANHWGVKLPVGDAGLRHALFEESDFEPRDWVTHSGWPFGREHLMPFYHRAQAVCGAGPLEYLPGRWEQGHAQRWPLDEGVLQTAMFQFSPAGTFTETYRQELVADRNVTLYTHASVVELITAGDPSRLARVRIARPDQADILLSARHFVLACGGFENARLLLVSNRQQPAGLGNRHDVVGRYYHDHPQGRSGYLYPKDPELLSRSALYDLRSVDGTSVMGYLKLAPAVLRKERLLNINCFLFPKPGPRQDRAIQSFNLLRSRRFHAKSHEDAPSTHPRQSLPQHALNVARGLDYVARMAYRAKTGQQASEYGLCHGGWAGLNDLPRRFERIEVWHSIEQSPHPENRVMLGRDTDRFGCPRIKLQWHWSRQDIDQVLRAQRVVARELERAGLGTLEIEHDPDGLPNIERPVGSHHLMGTTRMHVDPRLGVVDADCRVHGIANLFIAGSSTFPTGSYANPTLTLLALALRLADQIKQEFGDRIEAAQA